MITAKLSIKIRAGCPREKYGWQSLIGALAARYLMFAISEPGAAEMIERLIAWWRGGFSMTLPAHTNLQLPFMKSISYPLGAAGFIALTYFVIVGASNAINL